MAKGVNPGKDWCEMSKIVAHELGFDGWILVLIAPFPGHSLSITFAIIEQAAFIAFLPVPARQHIT